MNKQIIPLKKINMIKNIEIKTIVVCVIIFVLEIILIQQIWYKDLLERENFLNFDAQHYSYIKDNGYQGFRIAFFPLFPLIWRFFSVGVYGIVFINSIIFLTSFFILIKELRIKKIQEITFYLSIPSFIFFYLPYSESIFFLTSIVILLGLKRENDNLVYIGLFFSVLARPAFTIFLPALIITELINIRRDKLYFRIFIYVLLALIGTSLVAIIQYFDTNEWFKFFSVQKGWGNELQIPKLPFHTWGGNLIILTDGFAFIIGIIAGGFLLSIMLKLKWIKEVFISKDVIFSLSYLAGITLIVLLFRGGSLFSLNRFVFATPFIIVVLNYFINQKIVITNKKLLLIFCLIFLFWASFASYVHIMQILKYTFLTFYVILLFAIKSEKNIFRKYSIKLLIILNFTFLIIFYLRFLNGEWVG